MWPNPPKETMDKTAVHACEMSVFTLFEPAIYPEAYVLGIFI